MATAKIPGKKTSAPAREPKITIKQFVALAARQVRKDSKDLTKPSMFEALRELAPDLVYIEQKDAVTGMNKNPRYEDIQSVTIYGSVYLYSDKYLDARRAAALARTEELRGRIARKVRENSEKLSRPTSTDYFLDIVPDFTAEEMAGVLATVTSDAEYADIKTLTSYTGVTYLYSDKSLNEESAAQEAKLAEFRAKLLSKVRGDSRYLNELTDISPIVAEAPDVTPEEVETVLATLSVEPGYTDIKRVSLPNGSYRLFSELHVTPSYARILARTEANDPVFTIVETVRENAQVYPQPTSIETFKYKLFRIDRDDLDTYIHRAMEKNPDIKEIETGAGVYLYSSLYLTEDEARMVARKMERPG